MAYEILGIKLHTVKEAAAALDMSTKEIKRLLREGLLLGDKIAETWYVPDPGLKAFILVKGERQKIRDEALRLKGLLDDFLEKKDISQDYCDQAIKQLKDLLPEQATS